jgi:inosose dehydratase
MKARVGNAPDSWGVWFPGEADQPPWQRFLDEVSAAGFEWIELGPYGYLPTDPAVLQPELERRGLSVSGAFVMAPLEGPWPALREAAERTGELLSAVGAPYMVLIDDVYVDLDTGELLAAPELTGDEWQRLVENTHGVAEVAARYGLRLVFHPHAESHVEYEHQIERLLDDTDRDSIGLCFDIGHHAYRSGDVLGFIRKHHPRIPYLHLKSVDPDVQHRVAAEGIPFAKAVELEIFVEPARGSVDFHALRDLLEDIGYDGFAIVEQDMHRPPLDKPLPIARRTREYLRDVGIG